MADPHARYFGAEPAERTLVPGDGGRLGARVPQVTKWAPYYYFKHEATAAFLLEHGMDANHMHWHWFTLFHHMAAEGELGKAQLLLDHGADIDVIDDEYCSTPLGVAARRGQVAMVELLLQRGADPVAAGAPWAAPLAWAEKKGHQRLADMLRSGSGGRSGSQRRNSALLSRSPLPLLWSRST